MTNTAQARARAILKKYGKKLPRRWKGTKPVLHAWHQSTWLYLLTYEEYIHRIIVVEKTKPDRQKPTRFRLLSVIEKDLLKTSGYADWLKAKADWRKAKADLLKANWLKANRRKAKANWLKAKADWRKAKADWEKANPKLHDKLCGCKEWKENEIRFPTI